MTIRSVPLAWLPVAAASLLPACGGSPPHEEATTVAPADGAQLARSLACEPIELPERLFEGTKVLLLGDFHGTEEIPAFLSRLSCEVMRRGMNVIAALEIPREEKDRVDRYLDSTGTQADRRALLEGEFWTDVYQDGRRSRAMAALIERLRALRQAGLTLPNPRRLDVLLIDARDAVSPGERDRRMADAVLAVVGPSAAARQSSLLVTLAGNYHTRTVKGAPWDATYEPMGYHLARSLPASAVRSLDVAHAAGAAWFCTGAEPATCGEKVLKGNAEGSPGAIRLFDKPDDRGYGGTYFVGRLTASRPAREQ
jgi:hypothetical protein